jgi:hypothetical protein
MPENLKKADSDMELATDSEGHRLGGCVTEA